MKKTFALAACAALSLGFAACGDDDDDASGDTPALTVPEAAGIDADGTDAADAGTDTATDATTGAGDGEATEPAGTLSGEDADVLADCQTFDALYTAIAEEEVDIPEVGEEISDEYRDQVNDAIEQVEDLDLQTDEAKDARGALVDWLESNLDGDTFTEEMSNAAPPDELNEFGTRCAELLTASGG